MTYTIKNISNFCNVDYGFIKRIIDANELRPTATCGKHNEKKGYTFYQIYIIQSMLEQLMQRPIHLDFETEEVYTVYESKLNHLI